MSPSRSRFRTTQGRQEQAQEREWERRQAQAQQIREYAARTFASGTQRYGAPDIHELAVTEVDAAYWEARGRGEEWSDGRFQSLVADRKATLTAQSQARSLQRRPGWRVPDRERDTWLKYPDAAVTFDTEWGLVTLGASLARIYDLDGWPDAATLETMARQQAAREAVPA